MSGVSDSPCPAEVALSAVDMGCQALQTFWEVPSAPCIFFNPIFLNTFFILLKGAKVYYC